MRGRHSAAPLLCCVVLALMTAGCHRPSASIPGVTLQARITPQPVRVGNAAVSVLMKDVNRMPVTHAAVSFEGDMTHPGMSPVFGAAREVSPGNYQGSIDFSMGGDWVVTLHVRLADGRTMEREIPVKGVLSN